MIRRTGSALAAVFGLREVLGLLGAGLLTWGVSFAVSAPAALALLGALLLYVALWWLPRPSEGAPPSSSSSDGGEEMR